MVILQQQGVFEEDSIGGKQEESIDRVNSLIKGPDSASAQYLTTQPGTPSGLDRSVLILFSEPDFSSSCVWDKLPPGRALGPNFSSLMAAQYSAFMKEYLSLDHMFLVTNEDRYKCKYVLPYHYQDGFTTKLRIMFDGSAAKSSLELMALCELPSCGPYLEPLVELSTSCASFPLRVL
ncbi:GL21155 [Drosophila persimilis]|uniref:GL21155 n=1 Tax=Drosophila persimilis TaxID=7234 RepID=B4GX91_DROPE|nr:GL21155 [Drosophila persimilis]